MGPTIWNKIGSAYRSSTHHPLFSDEPAPAGGATLGARTAAPARHLGQMWTHSTFCRARGALKIFRSLLGPWLGTTTGKNNRRAVGLSGESPALAVRLGAQRGLLALTAAGALDALCFDRHFCPLSGRHASIIENLRDGCQGCSFSPWGGVCRACGGGAPVAPPHVQRDATSHFLPPWRSCVTAVEDAEQGVFCGPAKPVALAALGRSTTRQAAATRSDAPGATEGHFAAASHVGGPTTPTRLLRPLSAS